MPDYKITEELFVKAMTCSQKRRQAIVIAVCIIIPMAIYSFKGFPRETLVSVAIVYSILAFYFLVLAPQLNRMNFQRTYRRNPMLHKTQHVEITDSEIRFRSDHGESHYRLAEVARLEVRPDLAMIYPTTTIFHVIPTEVLSADELEILLRYARQ